MRLSDSNKIPFVSIILFIALVTVISYAEPLSQKSNFGQGVAMSNAKIPETFQNHLQSLDDRVKKLEDKEKPSKDFWDKFSSLSTFLSGVIIALIGIYATRSYNNRQLDSQRIQKERELSVMRVQTAEKFVNHLASEDERIRGTALESIVALGDEEFAARLARHCGGESGAAVLVGLSKSNNKVVRQTASEALREHFSVFQKSIIAISSRTGFFVSSDGLVLVPSSAFSSALSQVLQTVSIEIPSTGKPFSAGIKKVDDSLSNPFGLTLMKIEFDDPVVAIESLSDTTGIGRQVIALGFSQKSEWFTAVGRITGHIPGPTAIEYVACDIKIERGMEGAPVINTKGELVGIVSSADSRSPGICSLIPAIVVKELLGKHKS